MRELNIDTKTLSLTPRFSGVHKRPIPSDRFSSFRNRVETAEAVQPPTYRKLTLLKQGVNEKGKLQP